MTGSNFTSTSVVQWNGTALTTTYGSGAYLYGLVPASLLTSAGSGSVTVTSPTAVVPLSNALTVAVNNPPVPTLTSLSPNYGPISTATKITLTGTGFTSGSVVNLNGTALATTYTSSTTLSVSLTAAEIALPGNAVFTVTTPAAGGGTSGSQVFSAYIPLVSNSSVYNPVDGLIYASIPGSVGAPLGNSIVSVNPATGALGTPIPVGSEPDKLALTADGKFLWVSLDGSAAVRKVDLVAKAAGLQFTLPSNNVGWYNPPPTIQALAALPNATDSVIVAASNFALPVIFDSGVERGSTTTTTYSGSSFYSLQLDATRGEVYAAGYGYSTYTYSASGLTLKASNTTISPATSTLDEAPIVNGRLYTDQGKAYDAESGSLLGTLYLTGTSVAAGTTTADATLAKIFVLDTTSGLYYSGSNQIQIFSATDFTSSSTSIPVNVPAMTTSSVSVVANRLTRIGANGLSFRTGFGIYVLHSNAVQDLSASSADLAVTLSSTGASTTGGSTVFTATITNAGPSTANDVVVTSQAPAIGAVTLIVPSTGSCSLAAGSCSLGSLASGASALVTFTAVQVTAGTSTLGVGVSGSLSDPNLANNTASASVTVTGANVNLIPTVTSLSPASIQSGAADTVLTVNGTNFASSSTILLGGSTLSTTFVSSTKLTATVPAAKLVSLGWSPVTVSTPAAGGGLSAPLPLTIFTVLTVGVNHILYDPYSRKIMASVGSGSTSITGNSIAAITPETATVGSPVSIGSQPGKMALTSDGQILYTLLTGASGVARYNMLTNAADFSVSLSSPNSYSTLALRDIAAQPGTENTIAVDGGSGNGVALYDFNPTAKTAAIRGTYSGAYDGSCLQFLNSTNLYSFDIDTTGATLIHFPITSAGLGYIDDYSSGSTLLRFGCFKINGGLAFANAGGIANPATFPATQIATLPGLTGGTFSNLQAIAPDTSLQRAFYPSIISSSTYPYTSDGFTSFDLTTYLPAPTLPLNMAAIEGSTSSYNDVDLIRWGQDGLALLTSGGHIYLLRGAAVVPQLLNSNTPAVLSALSSGTVTHGAGNTLVTLTGSNFIPGVAVTLNGVYRTTTIVDATHISVALPSTDLTAAGTLPLIATNPGASASNTLNLTVN